MSARQSHQTVRDASAPLRVTEAAVTELARCAKEELSAGEFIRLSRAYQCGGSKFQLTVDDVMTPMDIQLDLATPAVVVVEKACLQLLTGCTLDFIDGAFVFLDALANLC